MPGAEAHSKTGADQECEWLFTTHETQAASVRGEPRALARPGLGGGGASLCAPSKLSFLIGGGAPAL